MNTQSSNAVVVRTPSNIPAPPPPGGPSFAVVSRIGVGRVGCFPLPRAANSPFATSNSAGRSRPSSSVNCAHDDAPANSVARNSPVDKSSRASPTQAPAPAPLTPTLASQLLCSAPSPESTTVPGVSTRVTSRRTIFFVQLGVFHLFAPGPPGNPCAATAGCIPRPRGRARRTSAASSRDHAPSASVVVRATRQSRLRKTVRRSPRSGRTSRQSGCASLAAKYRRHHRSLRARIQCGRATLHLVRPSLCCCLRQNLSPRRNRREYRTCQGHVCLRRAISLWIACIKSTIPDTYQPAMNNLQEAIAVQPAVQRPPQPDRRKRGRQRDQVKMGHRRGPQSGPPVARHCNHARRQEVALERRPKMLRRPPPHRAIDHQRRPIHRRTRALPSCAGQ